MGSRVWFKNIISKKKVKGDGSHKLKRYSAPGRINGNKEDPCSVKECTVLVNGVPADNQSLSKEYFAAVRIQTAYRAHVARKKFRKLRGQSRLQKFMQHDSVKKQASSTMSHLHAWTKVQAQIRARRVHMVAEGQLRQKKMENQLKLEAKLHDLEVEWTGGAETAGQALAKIHQREEAAVRRERAMAYAFTHQWRANSSPGFGSTNLEFSKENWGWSWKDRWIAARPWESRLPVKESPKKAAQHRPPNKISPTFKVPEKVKLVSPNGKATRKTGKLSYEAADKSKTAAQKVKPKAEEAKLRS
ncbi:IQ-domain 10 [Striga hermonthica]|uniref:IQ-domain 10 n=1 Tax=Striga hermonthica TaxID=68872 RepID=A0A9N7MSR0_STRHE|nr:IQ-domain 10 [Striga hermonthica]